VVVSFRTLIIVLENRGWQQSDVFDCSHKNDHTGSEAEESFLIYQNNGRAYLGLTGPRCPRSWVLTKEGTKNEDDARQGSGLDWMGNVAGSSDRIVLRHRRFWE
jgi:hypothetical protein